MPMDTTCKQMGLSLTRSNRMAIDTDPIETGVYVCRPYQGETPLP